MPESLTIPRNPALKDSQNFSLLREKGIELIEQLASELWTDYNAHDPGITLLELLCYGITDLGYRTGHPIEDLLTREAHGVQEPAADFHQAREILHSAPITFHDLRKILVDHPGIRHAWIKKMEEISYCLDEKLESLCPCPDESELTEIVLNGLYEVFLEFEDHIQDLSIGLADKRFGEGKYEHAGAGKLRFTVERDLLIKEVSIYADCPGHVRISLLDADENVIQGPIEVYVEHPGIKTSIPLDFFVAPHERPESNYYFLTAEGSDVNLYMTIGATFPFELEGLIRIDPSEREKKKDNYFFLYDWKIDFPDPSTGRYPEYYPARGQVGKAGISVQNGQNLPVGGRSMLFDVVRTCTLHAIWVYGDKTGAVTVIIEDEVGHEVVQRTINIDAPGRRTRVPFDYDLPACRNYTIRAESADGVELYASTPAEFPYFIPDVIYLVGGQFDGRLLQDYFFFYDWEVTYKQPVGLHIPALVNTKEVVMRDARDRLLSSRNLGEDLIRLKEVLPEEVGFCAEVDLDPSADEVEVLANLYFAFEEHVKPSVRFYSIEELRDKGKKIEEIFSGPQLASGFLDDDEFTAMDPSRPLFTSDMIRLAMQVSGVRGVREARISSFIDEVPVSEESWVWCPCLDPCRTPDFTPARSNIVFYKNGLPLFADPARTQKRLNELRATALRMRYPDQPKNLPIPVGEDMEVGAYFAVQNDLPLSYMVGEFRVPASADPIRKAQARQLKGFLMFFEQLLTNYLAQLQHIPQLFSWKKEEPAIEVYPHIQTYFTQDLGTAGIADLDDLFSSDPGARLIQLRTIIEDPETALDRRTRLLDHLIARFAESFFAYSTQMYRLMGDDEDVQMRLIEDRMLFLEHYPRISSHRGKAHDYRKVGDHASLSGYQERVYRLLGMRDVRRRPFCDPNVQVQFYENAWRVVVLDDEGNEQFVSASCASEAAARQFLDQLLGLILNDDHYIIDDQECEDGWGLFRVCKDQPNQLLGVFDDLCDRDQVIRRLKALGELEGFHLIEHILLRPRIQRWVNQNIEGDAFLPVQLPDECACEACNSSTCTCGHEGCIEVRDPYSFRISLVLPAWSGRFQNADFRRFVEETLRREAPAHLYLKICWLSYAEMCVFEECFCAWEEALACLDPAFNGVERDQPTPPNYGTYQNALNALIEKLFSLEQVFPPAHLHDCVVVPGEGPQVTLGTTYLATHG